MDALCAKLGVLTERLSQSIETLHSMGQSKSAAAIESAIRGVGEVSAEAHHPGRASGQTPLESLDPLLLPDVRNETGIQDHPIPNSAEGRSEDDVDSDSEPEAQDLDRDDTSTAGILVKDSYGNFRFIGGVTNTMLIEATQELSPNCTTTPQGPGTSETQDPKPVELPFFIPGVVWPVLPFLPKPEQLPRPPQYIADLLVGLYFDRIHYTFPIVFKPHFLQRYRQAYRGSSSGAMGGDRKFLMVFFAICACTSSLLPAGSGNQLTGNEYYEKSLLLYYSSAGEASLERVQCLGLLALCTAGWNILAQSWMLAGQAVRAAMDIGLHLDTHLVSSPSRSISRR